MKRYSNNSLCSDFDPDAEPKNGEWTMADGLLDYSEKKFFDTFGNFGSAALNGVTVDGTLISLTDITLGTSDSQRIGNKITGCSVRINWSVVNPLTTTAKNTLQYRVIVFIWKTEAIPDITDLLANRMDISPTIWHYNHDQKAKYKVLLDKCYLFQTNYNGTNVLSAYNPGNIEYDYMYLKDIGRAGRVHYILETDISEVAINKVYALLLSDAKTVLEAWDTSFNARYLYVDA